MSERLSAKWLHTVRPLSWSVVEGSRDLPGPKDPGHATELGIDGITDAIEVGRGGFAVVFRAYQPRFERFVAVKVLDAVQIDEVVRTAFERECRTIGRLSGEPNILTVHEAGFTTAGKPYMTMAYMPGGSLEDELRIRARLPWPDAVGITMKLARALGSAHAAGVLHCDLKPSNVLMSKDREPHLADFGIARIMETTGSTGSRYAFTPAHAPPEAWNRWRPTVAWDIYSLGSTLFELIAGHPAFLNDPGDSVLALMGRVAGAPVPDLRDHDVPSMLCEVIERAMAKAPDARPSSARAFAAQLEAARQEAATSKRATRFRQSPTRPSPPPNVAPPQAPVVPDPESRSSTLRGTSVAAVAAGVAMGAAVWFVGQADRRTSTAHALVLAIGVTVGLLSAAWLHSRRNRLITPVLGLTLFLLVAGFVWPVADGRSVPDTTGSIPPTATTEPPTSTSSPTATPATVRSVRSPVVFHDDFSEPEFGGWPAEISGSKVASYENGEYVVHPPPSGWTNYFPQGGSSRVEQVSVEVDGRVTTARSAKFGVVCRHGGRDDPFYAAWIDGRGFFQVFLATPELPIDNLATGRDPMTAAEPGQKLRVKLECLGRAGQEAILRLSVNDRLVTEATDLGGLGPGAAGLITGGFGTPGADIAFDNFTVTRSGG